MKSNLIFKNLKIYEIKKKNVILLGDTESEKFQSAVARFKRLFGMPNEEKLVNCKKFIILMSYILGYIMRFLNNILWSNIFYSC